jgi:rhodanese-related sulfurtransferase
VALELIEKSGFNDELVTVLAGGWDAWLEKGYPTASGETLDSSGGGTTPAPTTTAPAVEKSEFDVVQAAANAYLTSSPQWNTTAKDLYLLLNDGDSSNDPVIVSVRAPADYAKGHIPGAINIPLADLAKPESLAKLPAHKKIVVYCYTGHTGSQATAILNLLGYDATNLKFGMTSWTKNTDVASGRYDESKDCMDYVYVTGTSDIDDSGCG